MRQAPLERVGVLVLRAWIEPRYPTARLRVRITANLDIRTQADNLMVVGGVEAAVAVVRGWLEAFAGENGEPG